MKKRLSAYWWCQIVGWSMYSMLYSTSYFSLEPNTFYFFNFLFLLVAAGISVTHLMRLVFIKSGLMQLNILRQIIYIFLATFFFAAIYSLIVTWLTEALNWYVKTSSYSFWNQANKSFSYCFINLSFWNMIYFSYRYIQRTRREQIERSDLQNMFKLQQLESESIEAELKQQKTELEAQALRAQMNPHFIFNSLNSINRFILKKQTSEAADYLTKFSRLIRMVLNSSANAVVSLGEELEALTLYHELERLRCEEKFDFDIQCDPDLDFIKVPPMLIQPFVENAIWHGLMNKKDKGHLSVNIRLENPALIYTITDDGIGRKKAGELNKRSGNHKSMGVKITESRIAMMQQMNSDVKSIELKDLVYDDGSAAGTEVVLKLPIQYP